MQELNEQKDSISRMHDWDRAFSDLEVLLEVAQEAQDETVLAELSTELDELERQIDAWNYKTCSVMSMISPMRLFPLLPVQVEPMPRTGRKC